MLSLTSVLLVGFPDLMCFEVDNQCFCYHYEKELPYLENSRNFLVCVFVLIAFTVICFVDRFSFCFFLELLCLVAIEKNFAGK